ncbi:MAG: hypothetical protein CM15mP18_0430 [Methanobacteriota archaeon]|nr:MAG: hypothetical protein CM15mP18_0430 [Euryarchaeota archaeon]
MLGGQQGGVGSLSSVRPQKWTRPTVDTRLSTSGVLIDIDRWWTMKPKQAPHTSSIRDEPGVRGAFRAPPCNPGLPAPRSGDAEGWSESPPGPLDPSAPIDGH